MNLNFNAAEADSGDGFMKTVHMHMPNRQARNYIDALLAFWPGLQVLKGDIKGAIKFHESLHQIVKKHDFLPEAVLFDHSVHWSNHPLRPEFLESTYYLYRATKDDYYLQIAKKMVEQLEKYSRVKCGYAAIANVKTKTQEDRMDSFVFAETFKYLYLMFVEDQDLIFDIDDFIFTTEAHLVPLNFDDYISKQIKVPNHFLNKNIYYDLNTSWKDKSCPSLNYLFGIKDDSAQISLASKKLRDSVGQSGEQKCSSQSNQFYSDSSTNKVATNLDKLKLLPLRAHDFVAGRKDHMEILNKMGIKLSTMQDGRVQLVHKTSEASNYEDAEMGILFMTDMLEFSKKQDFKLKSNNVVDDYRSMSVLLLSTPFNGTKSYLAGPAQFGFDLRKNLGVFGKLLMANPIDLCSDLLVHKDQVVYDKILVAKRGNCMFIEKARRAENSGALGLIIVDNSDDSSYSSSSLFAMSGDGVHKVKIPSVFMFGKEGNDLMWNMRSNRNLIVYIGDNSIRDSSRYPGLLSGAEKALNFRTEQLKFVYNSGNYKNGFVCCKKISLIFLILI